MESPEPPKSKKRGNRRALQERTLGRAEGLLRLQIYTATHIARIVGVSTKTIYRMADSLGIPLPKDLTPEQKKERLADLFGDVAVNMLESFQNMTPREIRRIAPAKRMLIAGIATDKVHKLDGGPDKTVRVELNWVNVVQQNTPGRQKGMGEITDATIVPVSVDEDFLK